MSDLSETAEAVRASLEQQPTLNTPTLIAGGPVVPEGTGVEAIEAALDELIEAGIVKRRPTGWKLAKK